MNYDWIKEIPNYLDFFTNDQKIMIEVVGIEKYMELHERFGSTSFYFSNQSMVYAKKAWAQKNRHIHYSEAARILGVSVQSIYNWREEKNSDNLNLFEAKK
ncbi:MAG: hypothetical protein KF816_11575 [Melioribacteraceae bacterium]|nr:hypothetical protein [Melioribacteraceae bacterium]